MSPSAVMFTEGLRESTIKMSSEAHRVNFLKFREKTLVAYFSLLQQHNQHICLHPIVMSKKN